MSLLLSTWKKITSVGVLPGMEPRQSRMIRLTNRLSIAGIFALLLGALHTLYVDDVFLAAVIAGCMCVFSLTLLLNGMGLVRFAMYYMLLVINGSIFYFDGYCGPNGGVYFYYFPIILTIAFLFDYSQVRPMVIFMLVTGAFFFVGIVTNHELFSTGTLSEWQVERMWRFNLFNSILFVVYFTVVIMRMNYEQVAQFEQRMKERKEAEERIRMALREKETLLAEVHHRVKNNLAVVSSMLNMQSNLVNHDYTREVLIESRNRVASMALIHQKLYSNNSFAELNFGSYISELVEEIKQSYSVANCEKVKIVQTCEPHPLSLTTAIPCGLILNELLSNCYKHAFHDREEGEVHIAFLRENGRFVLRVTDDGNGLPDGFDHTRSESLGITIISSLADQLDARFGYSGRDGSGTVFSMQFEDKGGN